MKTISALKTIKIKLAPSRQDAKKFMTKNDQFLVHINALKSLRLCVLARGFFLSVVNISIFILFLNGSSLIAQSQDDEMSSSRYVISHSAIVGAGGYLSNPSFSLQQQFSLPNMGKMEGGNFVIGTAVELKRVQTDVLPTRYSMLQNYPNPFNHSTTFVYSLPEKSDITISLYSMLGREIAVLVQGEQNAGRFNLKYNGLDSSGYPLPSGLYFCRLTSQKGFDKTIKFAILR